MSRSRRKQSVLGRTAKRSEQEDKKIWHSRWRAQERVAWAKSLRCEDFDHMPVPHRQVSNVRTMSKEGHVYWPAARRVALAEAFVADVPVDLEQRKKLTKRKLIRWLAK